jgi:predicted CXXCH cytochrome family protein
VNHRPGKTPDQSCLFPAGDPVPHFGAGKAAVCLLLLLCTGVLADVRETPHNLIKSRDKSVSDKQVCVFCHTPLNEVGDAKGSGPIAGVANSPRWQKSLTDGFVFTIYDDIGRLGLGKPSVGSQSIACLSCHDSNQAFTVGKTSADHPFGVPYRGAVKNLGPAGVIVTPKGDESTPFRAAQHLMAFDDFREVSQGTVEDRTVFWVSRSGITARRTRNDLPLYGRADPSNLPVRDALAPVLLVPHIECSSCHDPHTQTETFLRVPPGESMLCLTCHDK